MKSKNIFFVILVIIFYCKACNIEQNVNNYHASLIQKIENWLSNNNRLETKYILSQENKNLIIYFEKDTTVGSYVIENIAGINLANNIFNIDSNEFKIKYDTLKICYLLKLNKNNAKNVFEKNEYSFPQKNLRDITKNLSNPIALNVSNYITFNITNEEGADFLQANHSLNKFFEWYDYEGNSLNLLYDYSILKNSISTKEKQEIEHLELEILALYRLFEEANFESIRHIDTILRMNQVMLPNFTLKDLMKSGITNL